MLPLFFLACQPEALNPEIGKQLLLEEFQKANNTDRLSWQIAGKGQWFDGVGFNYNCLGEKDLGFQHHLQSSKTQPTLRAQKYITTSTKRATVSTWVRDSLSKSTELQMTQPLSMLAPIVHSFTLK